LSNNSVRSILEDKSGNLWFGTDGGGVSRYDGESFVHFTEKEGLNNNSVWSILEDKSGNLWFGTQGGGVSKYNGESFVHFTEAAGLSNNRVRSILEDNNRNLYITTVKGLTQISPLPASPEGGEVFAKQVFGTQDGLKGLDFYHNSAFIDSKNRAWWGSGKGLTMLDLNKFNLSTQIPQPLLKQLDINEQFLDYRNISDSLGNEIAFKSVQKFENYPLNLELPYHKNHLTFHFAAIDWNAPHKIHYSYRMLGLNDNWSNPTREAKADYRNLPYGTYTFQIKAIGESGVWSEPFDYTFTINPPWWQSWWAYLGYTLLFLLALRIFSKYRERHLRAEKEKLEQTVEERTSSLKEKSEELVHSLEDLKSTQAQLIQSEKMASLGELTAGIAHEIQNPLNFVNNFSELNAELLQELKEELDNGNLEEVKAIADDLTENERKITHHGKRADAIVKGMLAHSRSGKGEKEPTDLNALAEEYLKLSYHGLRARDKSFNADFKTDFDPNLPKVNIVPQDIGRVLLNLINNAFQASSGHSDKPKVTVATKKTAAGIEISVSDNGPGIPDSIKDKIFQPFFTTKPAGQGTGLGLSLSYDIVKAHGGELKIESTTTEGAVFTIVLPTKAK
jgi:signal transduction histidine kinase